VQTLLLSLYYKRLERAKKAIFRISPRALETLFSVEQWQAVDGKQYSTGNHFCQVSLT
jgi:hypothetical protein